FNNSDRCQFNLHYADPRNRQVDSRYTTNNWHQNCGLRPFSSKPTSVKFKVTEFAVSNTLLMPPRRDSSARGFSIGSRILHTRRNNRRSSLQRRRHSSLRTPSQLWIFRHEQVWKESLQDRRQDWSRVRGNRCRYANSHP